MKQVAVGIILKNGLVLACQRKANARYPLKWEFPGGKLEEGESPAEALVRELHEELSIHAVVEREFHRQEWVYNEGLANPPLDGSFRVFYFLVREFSHEPVYNAFEQIRWVRPSELVAMDILEGNRKAVELFTRYAKEEQAA